MKVACFALVVTPRGCRIWIRIHERALEGSNAFRKLLRSGAREGEDEEDQEDTENRC